MPSPVGDTMNSRRKLALRSVTLRTVNGMLLGFMSESHFSHGKMILWQRDSFSSTSFFFEVNLWRFLCGDSWRNFWYMKLLCLKITLNFSCAVLGSSVWFSWLQGRVILGILFQLPLYFAKVQFCWTGMGARPEIWMLPWWNLSPGNLACLQWLRNEIMNL